MNLLLDLIARTRGADLYVLTLLACAHQLGADTVPPQWLRLHCTYPQDAIADSLAKFRGWLLAEMPLRNQWRLTASGHQLALPLIHRLSTGTSPTPLCAESDC